MRLICTFPDESLAKRFSAYLRLKGIKHELEKTQNTDWGSPHYASQQYHVWIEDEDEVPVAQELYEKFQSAPEEVLLEEPEIQQPSDTIIISPKVDPLKSKVEPQKAKAPLTIFLIVLCSIIFLIEATTVPILEKIPAKVPITPIATPPIYKEMMYDYPLSYQMIDTIVKTYGIESLTDTAKLPASGQLMLNKALTTPHWNGIYPDVVESIKKKENKIQFDKPMFEKISQGELWRLLTPILLHSNIFHLFFNMLWVLILGRQMEERIGRKKLLLFVLLTGIFSNTAQYLMSGPNFIGFSGVICAMVAFIWVRQRYYAWEGYSIQPSTLNFVAFFVILMFIISFTAFVSEIYFGMDFFGAGIANTAHLAGAFIGYLLGFTKLFKT